MMKRIIIRIVAFISDILFINRIYSYINRKKLLIIGYHRVLEEQDGCFPAVNNDTFRREMQYLKNRYNIISLKEAAEALKSHRKLPDYTAVITFDDGYRDIYVHAFPVLKDLKIPATVFFTADYIDNKEIPWWDIIGLIFNSRKKELFDHVKSALNIHARRKSRLLDHLKTVPDEQRAGLIHELKTRFDAESLSEKCADPLMMRRDEIREMQQGNISIGSHTLSHPVLSRVPEEQALREISGSKKILEHELGCEVPYFAYPVGRKADYNEDTKRLVSGEYECAVTTVRGLNSVNGDLYELKRVLIGTFSFRWFKSEISGFFPVLRKITGLRFFGRY